MVLPRRGLTRRLKGCFQGEVPVVGKERIRPTLMIPSPAATLPARPLTENTPQAHAHPAVHGHQRRPTTLLEVPKPTTQRPIHADDDNHQRVPVRPLRFRPDRVLDLLPPFLPRPPRQPPPTLSP